MIPVIVRIAPPLVLGTLIFLALKELFSDEDTEMKPETAPANTEAEKCRKEAKTIVFPTIPAEIFAKSATAHIPSALKSFIPPFSVSPMHKIPAPAVPVAVAIPKIMTQVSPPPPIKNKFITREHMATIFYRGARALTRTEAVEALKKLGFGKTAAYEALLENGRFSAWLQFAPDGIITWKS